MSPVPAAPPCLAISGHQDRGVPELLSPSAAPVLALCPVPLPGRLCWWALCGLPGACMQRQKELDHRLKHQRLGNVTARETQTSFLFLLLTILSCKYSFNCFCFPRFKYKIVSNWACVFLSSQTGAYAKEFNDVAFHTWNCHLRLLSSDGSLGERAQDIFNRETQKIIY